MQFNKGGSFNLSPFNVVFETEQSYTGLKLLKCANWAEGPTHGGVITDTEVDVCWDYISEYENVNGASDYRKCFIKNFGTTDTGECVIRPSFIAPNDLTGRLSAIIAIGTATDTMSNKPSDGVFGASINTEIAAGASISVWLKRTITAGGSTPGSYLGVQFVMTVSED